MSVVKDEVRRMVDGLSETDSWEDIMYKIYVRESIEHGLDDVKKGRTLNEKQVKERLSKWLS